MFHPFRWLMLLFGASPSLAAEPEKPKFKLGKDTTFVTEPLDKDGYIDYETALNERMSKGIKPETNANVLIWQALGPKPEGQPMAAGYFRRLGVEPPPESGDYFVGFRRFLKDTTKKEPTDDQLQEQTQIARQPWAAKDHPEIAAWLAANEKPLDLIVKATLREQYFNPIVSVRKDGERGLLFGGLLPTVQRCREVSVALCGRAMRKVDDGKHDEAWQDVLASHRLSRLVARGGTMLELLVGYAVEAITQFTDVAYLTHVSEDSKKRLDRLKDLRRLAAMPSLAEKIALAERFSFLDAVQTLHNYGFGVLENMFGEERPDKPDDTMRKALDLIDWETVFRITNGWFDRFEKALRLTDRTEREKEIAKIAEELRTIKDQAGDAADVVRSLKSGEKVLAKELGERVGKILNGSLAPAFDKMQVAADRFDQQQRTLHLAFALAAHSADNKKYPAALADLAPKYIDKIPDDLFTGKPLIYKPTDTGYLLYSVGVNGTDDGGRTFSDDPPGDDLVVRMPSTKVK